MDETERGQWYCLLCLSGTATLVSAFMLSRLDYCNAVLAGLPKSTILPLQQAQNAATRLVCTTQSTRSCVCQLHWLLVEYWIAYKLRLLMHLIHTSRAPSYLMDIVTPTTAVSSRSRVWSGSSLHYEQPRMHLSFGQRAFSYVALSAWNKLPTFLQQLTDTKSFKHYLKSVLFLQAFT